MTPGRSTEGVEVRSYRRVFALERRIYRIDRLRLNPGGIPLRGLLYAGALMLLALLAGTLPLVGTALSLLPWYVRDVLLPSSAATLLTAARLEGRPFHVGAWSMARAAIAPRRLIGLCRCVRPAPGGRWSPEDMVLLPDGSDARLRRLRFRGPGVAFVAVGHELTSRRGWRGGGAWLALRGVGGARPLRKGRVVAIAHGARLEVLPSRPRTGATSRAIDGADLRGGHARRRLRERV